jgi:hypothetical protein
MRRAIVSFRQDEEGHWVAELVCGHSQHVRHKPPFVERPWVMTEQGRAAHIGTELECKLCNETALKSEAPSDPRQKRS